MLELMMHFKHEIVGIRQRIRIEWNFELNMLKLTVSDL